MDSSNSVRQGFYQPAAYNRSGTVASTADVPATVESRPAGGATASHSVPAGIGSPTLASAAFGLTGMRWNHVGATWVLPCRENRTPEQELAARLATLSEQRPALAKWASQHLVLDRDTLTIQCAPSQAVTLISRLMTDAERQSFGKGYQFVPEQAAATCLQAFRKWEQAWVGATATKEWPAGGQAPHHWPDGPCDTERFDQWAAALVDSPASFVAGETHNRPGALIFLAANAARIAPHHTVFTEMIPLELQAQVDSYLAGNGLDLELDAYMQLTPGGALRPLLACACAAGLSLVGIDSFMVFTTGIEGPANSARSAAMNAVAAGVMRERGIAPGATGAVIHCGIAHAALDRDDPAQRVVGLGPYFGMPSIFFEPLSGIAFGSPEIIHQSQVKARQVVDMAERPGYGRGRDGDSKTEYGFSRQLTSTDRSPEAQKNPATWDAAYDIRVSSAHSLWLIDAAIGGADPTARQLPAPPDDDEDSTPRGGEENSPRSDVEDNPRLVGSGSGSDSDE